MSTQFVDKYHCPAIRRFVIKHIWEVRYTYHPVELVQLGSQFNISELFRYGFKRLLDIPLKRINREHRQTMANDVFAALAYSKSVLDEHARIVVCEESGSSPMRTIAKTQLGVKKTGMQSGGMEWLDFSWMAEIRNHSALLSNVFGRCNSVGWVLVAERWCFRSSRVGLPCDMPRYSSRMIFTSLMG